jgi:hypothetical protein
MLCGEQNVSAIQVQSTIFSVLLLAASSVSIPKRIQHPLATTVQIVDFREATFNISGGCFSNFFWKMAKRTLGENPQDLYITIVKKKNDLFEYTS